MYDDLLNTAEVVWRKVASEDLDELCVKVRSALSEHGSSASDDEILETYDNLKAKLERRRGKIYRVMRLPESAIAKLKAGASLGQHWSLDSDVPPENLYTNRKYPEGGLYIFAAKIDSYDVLWHMSVAYNIWYPEEEEIFVNRGTMVFQGVFEQGSDKNLRPDLVGKRVGA